MPDDMPEKFTAKFKLLPPDLQLTLWKLALDASVSDVRLIYQHGAFKTYLAYNYGGNLEAALPVALPIGQLDVTAGVNPGNGDVSAGLAFRGFDFKTTANFTKGSFNFKLGYAAKLLPFPAELTSTFNSAGSGLVHIWKDDFSNNLSAIARGVSAVKQIDKYGSSDYKFGADITLSHTNEVPLLIMLRFGMTF